MPKRTDIKKVLVIGSGPIVIGQAAEFDYAGTQACLALREEGYEVVLANSNPATIMTDTTIADKVYMEPLTLEYLARICRYERPDAIVPGIGGQTGLNLAMQLAKKGVLKECEIELLGTDADSIERAEDRELFKELCESIGEPIVPSQITYSIEEGLEAAEKIGYPVILRPAFTLGGTGGGFLFFQRFVLFEHIYRFGCGRWRGDRACLYKAAVFFSFKQKAEQRILCSVLLYQVSVSVYGVTDIACYSHFIDLGPLAEHLIQIFQIGCSACNDDTGQKLVVVTG